jgi:GST-like protein
MTGRFEVFGERGSGNVAVEAALTLIGVPFSVIETPTNDPARPAATPLGQVPALRLPNGAIMTESAAILIWLADAYPDARLAPSLGSPDRPAFLRWMSFVSSAIYALYWVKDVPSRVVETPEAQALVKARLADRIVHCWSLMEREVNPDPYLLGEDISVLDLYVATISRWTPRDALHQTAAPKIGAVARRVENHARLAALWAQRFPLSLADQT